MSVQEYHASVVDQPARDAESWLRDTIAGRENALFLVPKGAHYNIAVEAWQVAGQWDLQSEDGVLYSVAYGRQDDDPDYRLSFANMKSRITSAMASDAFAGKRIANVSGLNQFYRDIGAYGDITPDDGSTDTFTPGQPPVYDN